MIRVPLGPLRERQFRLLFAGRTISRFGSALAPVALAFAVLDLTGSASDLGLVLAGYSVSSIVFILVGGIWADRLPRDRMMVVANLVQGAAQAGTAALLLLDAAEVWHLAALAAASAFGFALFFPASQGIVPQLVTPRLLQEANALLRLSLNATGIAGAAAAGLLVASIGSGWAIALDAATFAACAAVLSRIRLPHPVNEHARNSLRELREGWSEFASRTWLWVVVIAFAFINALGSGAFQVLGPLVARNELGGAAAWGLILACQGFGLLAGGAILLRVKPERLLLWGMLATIITVPPLVLLAVGAPAWLVALSAVGWGVGFEFFGVMWDTSMQQHIPADKLSRVYAYDALGSWVLMPVGFAIVGPVAAAVGVDETLWLVAGSVLLAVALTLAVADVRNLRRLAPVPA